jgi:adenosylcobinamide-GDP ribazoletransferase
MSAASDLRDAVAFLTPLRLTRSGQPDPPSPGSMAFFPLVGAALGALVGLTWRQARCSFPALLAAALVVAADGVVTGALHLDGVADTADGLLAHVPVKHRLDIMAEPAIGTFAVVAVGAALATRTAALAALEPSIPLLVALYCSSRSVMVIGSRTLPYARKKGLVSSFLPDPGPSQPTGNPRTDRSLLAATIGAAGALGLAAAVAGRRGASAVVAGWVAAGVTLECAHRRLGGYTGDVLGAAGVSSEICGLVWAARGRRA